MDQPATAARTAGARCGERQVQQAEGILRDDAIGDGIDGDGSVRSIGKNARNICRIGARKDFAPLSCIRRGSQRKAANPRRSFAAGRP